MRSRVEELATFGALNEKRAIEMATLREACAGESRDLKNLCFKVAPELADRCEATVKRLGLFKREFLESALLDALAAADAIAEREGLDEVEAGRLFEAPANAHA